MRGILDVHTYMSIGEVLNLLKDEFPDVTISKIRFLESQGLLEPERTPSGYRKFFDGDVDRLRFILREQRERYLPLKIIRSKLAQWDAGNHPQAVRRDGTGAVVGPSPEGRTLEDEIVVDPPHALNLTAGELAEMVGVPLAVVAELKSYGLIVPTIEGAAEVYDADAILTARIARGFFEHGVEPRHLRMYRTSIDRESAFFEQVVTPLLRQRNPDARRSATEVLSELSSLARQLKQVLLRRNLRSYLQE